MFPTKLQEVEIGRLRVPLEAVHDFDAVLDYYARQHATDLRMLPYYATLWPSALALARFLEQSCPTLAGATVVELGCGLGLPAIVAGLLGGQVTAIDQHPHNLQFLQRNVELNGLSPAVHCRSATWESLLAEERRFDLVLGSDLLYDREHVNSLCDCIARIVSPGGQVLLSDPGRDHLQPALDRLTARGFQATLHTVAEIFVLELRPPRE